MKGLTFKDLSFLKRINKDYGNISLYEVLKNIENNNKIKQMLKQKGYLFNDIQIIYLHNLKSYSTTLIMEKRAITIYINEDLQITKLTKAFDLK